MTRSRPKLRIGCAGWSIASAHAAEFGAGESMLARYATRFNCVEINSSFYRSHQPKTYARWAASVPTGFRFSVKVPKAITHDARLARSAALVGRFADEVLELGPTLGGVLVQLPPSLAMERRTARAFFAAMRRYFDIPIACEPRHASWFEPAAETLWSEFDVARVAADPARVPGAAVAGGQGAWTYTRWHGSPRMYYSAYSDDALRALATTLTSIGRVRRPAWCIFDNTTLGHATSDALRLQQLCDGLAGG